MRSRSYPLSPKWKPHLVKLSAGGVWMMLLPPGMSAGEAHTARVAFRRWCAATGKKPAGR